MNTELLSDFNTLFRTTLLKIPEQRVWENQHQLDAFLLRVVRVFQLSAEFLARAVQVFSGNSLRSR